ncbi:MAG: C10 family peptidase, partial [Bacteroidales bacterium]|nr:C10 family peptidase [Bacteroidales bacterium]
MKKIPLLLLSLFYPIILLSQSINISETDALKVATNQYALVLNAKENINYSTINAYTISSLAENDTLLAYVIGFKNRKGFVILPAIIYYDPWIAVSTESNFNTENVIPPLQMVLESVKSNILNSLRFPGENSSRHKLLWSRLASIDASCFSGREPFEYDTIGPLITSTWSQGKYYNASCPAVYGGDASQDWRALAGCGPIAMAQIIRFHEWPPEYNFSNMPNSLINYNQDVAKLISDCGEAADAWYHENWTSVWPWEVDDALKNGFGYSSAVYQDRISSFSIGESWKQRIANHLRNNYPVIYYGREEWTFSAHLFILDGFVGLDLYSPNLFHVNWGWAGNYDGYFDLDDLTPSNYNFNDIQGMIHPIRPPGKVTITNPVAGQHVLSSHELTVEWTCTDQAADMEHAMIIFHMPNHWGDTIVEQTDNDGSYTFTVPNQPNDDVKAGIEVWVYGKYKFRDILWRHENPFYVDNGSSLSITAPTYSTSWRANTIQQISWDSYPHNGVNLKIDFYNTNQGFGNVVHSTTGIAYNWLIPEHLSGQYYITMRDLNDDLSFYETSNLFTILPAKTIEITSPHYNDQYTLGDVLDIRWNDDISENVKIKLQRWDDWD